MDKKTRNILLVVGLVITLVYFAGGNYFSVGYSTGARCEAKYMDTGCPSGNYCNEQSLTCMTKADCLASGKTFFNDGICEAG